MARGRAKIAIGDGLAVWLLDAPEGFGDVGFHAHHAIQLTIAIEGSVSIESNDGSITGSTAAVATDTSHSMTGCGLIAIVFVDPEGETGRRLSASLFEDRAMVPLPEQTVRAPLLALTGEFRQLSRENLLAAGGQAIARMLPTAAAALPDPRIARVLAHLRDNPGDTLIQAAEAQGVFLSPERLRHLFVEQTGLPHKSYVLWLRMTNALRAYSNGATLTEAAHEAGFADSAHLSRVFRRTFGAPATTLTRV